MTEPVAAAPEPTWPGPEDVVLVLARPEDYKDALTDTLGRLVARFGAGVVVTANRPVRVLRDALDAAGVDRSGIKFVDCISGLTGFTPPNEADAVYVDSPTLLEKTGLRAEQLLRRMEPGARFLFIDSLSTLAVYNGPAAVAELAHNLTTRMRLLGAATVLLLVQGNDTNGLEESVRAHCDRVRTA